MSLLQLYDLLKTPSAESLVSLQCLVGCTVKTAEVVLVRVLFGCIKLFCLKPKLLTFSVCSGQLVKRVFDVFCMYFMTFYCECLINVTDSISAW